MTINGFRRGAPNVAYIGAAVTMTGTIFGPDGIAGDGLVDSEEVKPANDNAPNGWVDVPAREGKRLKLDAAE